MTRRAAASRPKKDVVVLPPATEPPQPEEIEEQDEDERDPLDIIAFRSELDPAVIKKTVVWVYRQRPKIRTKGKKRNIDTYDFQTFSYDQLVEDHGGGKYKLWADVGDGIEHTFYYEDPKPALIHPEFYVVDDYGNLLNPTAPVPSAENNNGSSNGNSGSMSRQEVKDIIDASTSAARTGNEATAAALNAGIQLVSTGAAEALRIVADAKANSKGDSSGLAELRAELKEIKDSIKDQRIAKLEQTIEDLKRQPASTTPAAPNELAAAVQTATLLGVDGGLMGLVKTVSGAEVKEEGVLDHIGKGIGEGIKSLFTDYGGHAIQAFREWTHLKHVEALQKQQPGATPPPPPQPLQRPLGPAAPQQQPTEEEEMLNVVNEITDTIRTYYLENFDGAGVAVIVKKQFRAYLPFITTLDIFKDFGKMMEFCRGNVHLKEFVGEGDFDQFAQDFFNSFQPQPAPPAGGPEANTA